MTNSCPECGAPVETVHGMPGRVVCTDEDCELYNVAFTLDE